MSGSDIIATEQLVREVYPGVSLGAEDGCITVIKIDGKTYSLHTVQSTVDPPAAARAIIDMVRDFHYARNDLRPID